MRRILRPVDVVLVICGVTLLGFVWIGPRANPRRTHPAVVIRQASRDLPALQDSLAAQEQRLRSRSPFRPANASETPQPSQLGMGVPPAVARMMPMPAQVAVQGVAGPPWRAVLSGLPGRPGQTVVMVGDTVGNARIRVIRRDTVVIQLGDSTLHLTLTRGTR